MPLGIDKPKNVGLMGKLSIIFKIKKSRKFLPFYQLSGKFK